MEGSARMPLIRKERAGNDSFGNSWPEDGAVVEVDPEHAAVLLAIDDGGFSEVTPAAEDDAPEEPQEPEAPEAPEEPAKPDEPGPEEEKELSEVDPEAPPGEPESKTPAKKTAARKTTARKPVEEG
jgi:hypothetical protein